MSNSNLITYTKISPNKTVPRNHIIDTITVHCMAGNLSLKNCGDLFAKKTKKSSSNYGIDSDGNIAMYVEEKDRSWCSSSSSNDNRAVTIEVANDGGAETGWHISDMAMASLIKLISDICKRNSIKEMKWKANKKLIGKIAEQNMTVHRWFANKSCPGDYIYNKHGYISQKVNEVLNKPSMDYSLVFDAEYYANKYPDLKENNIISPADLLNHFLNYGINERRQAISTFDVNVYMKHADLSMEFKTNYKEYYLHYINFGHSENRKAI